jgi:polysaccharide export outer membrane protein
VSATRARRAFRIEGVTLSLRYGLLLVALLAAPVAGAEVLNPAPASYVVGTGDVLEITIYAGGEKQDEFTGTVSAAGTIVCPMLGEFKLAGLDAPDIAQKMRAILVRDYYVDPQVIVSVKEYAGKIFIMGEVKHPGIYPVRDGLTLLGACDLAGGFTDFASTRRVKIVRGEDGRQKPIEIDLARVKRGKSVDLALQSGDRIEIPRRWF